MSLMKEIKALFFLFLTAFFVLNASCLKAETLDSLSAKEGGRCAYSTKGEESTSEVLPTLKEKALQVSVALTLRLGEEAIKSLSEEAKLFNAKLLIRGIPLTEKEKETLLSRGHFGEALSTQEENRAIVRQGFMRLAPLVKAGVPLEIDPKFFKEHAVESAPLILFQYGEKVIRVRGVASIQGAASLAASELQRKEEKPFLDALTALKERGKIRAFGRSP